MLKPLEITYRNVLKTGDIESLIQDKVKKLEKIYDNIVGCLVVLERPHSTVQTGNQFKVRIDLTIPHGKNIVVTKNPGNSGMHQTLDSVIRDSFDAAEKQLKKIVQQQRNKVKSHPQQVVTAIVSKIFPDEGYGFLRTINGREIYFHKNSVLNDEFDKLETGVGVRFFEEEGEKGPQASTVQIIEKSSKAS
jgi:cold shock CspA family protein